MELSYLNILYLCMIFLLASSYSLKFEIVCCPPLLAKPRFQCSAAMPSVGLSRSNGLHAAVLSAQCALRTARSAHIAALPCRGRYSAWAPAAAAWPCRRPAPAAALALPALALVWEWGRELFYVNCRHVLFSTTSRQSGGP